MDNITHSLVGCTLAECVFQRMPAARKPTLAPRLRRAFWLVSLVGNNFPDLDFLYSRFMMPTVSLGNLLHHRGHTHTFGIAILEGAILGALIYGFLLRGVKKISRRDRVGFWSVAVLGPVLHIAMDSLNSYGVHPFWPLWNRWVFGDTLFILEPLLWLALLPAVYFVTQNRVFRRGIEAVLIALFTALWIFPLAPWYAVLGNVGFGLFVWAVARKLKPGRRADFGAGMGCLVVLLFALVSSHVRAKIVQQNRELHPTATLHDVVLSPFPSNPFCWSVITVETFSDASRYRVRRGKVAPFASWVSVEQCPRFPIKGSTAYLTPIPTVWGPEYDWEGQYQASVSDLKGYAEYSCPWLGFLEFARVPFLQEEGGSLWAGDLRFDYGPELGFAEIEASEQNPPCKGWFPHWTRPRYDIF